MAEAKYKKIEVGGHKFEYRIEDICVYIQASQLNIKQVVACDIISGESWEAIDYGIYKGTFKMNKKQVENYIEKHIIALPPEHW